MLAGTPGASGARAMPVVWRGIGTRPLAYSRLDGVSPTCRVFLCSRGSFDAVREVSGRLAAPRSA